MNQSTYQTLFDAALSLAADGDASERRRTASRTASLLTRCLGSSSPAAALREANPEIVQNLGSRGADRLVAIAAGLVEGRVATRWKPGSRPRIAILTSKSTAEMASDLDARLQTAGAEVWFYGRSIRLGRRIRKEDEAALLSADYVVLLVSRDAIESNFVDYELDIVQWLEMKDRRERLLPVIADDLTFEELPAMLGPIKAVAIRDGGLEMVVDTIAARIDEDRSRRN